MASAEKLSALAFLVWIVSGCALQSSPNVRDCAACPLLVRVPAGTFQMGSPPTEAFRGEDEGPVREVTIERPFYVGAYEITIGEYGVFLRESGHEQAKGCLVFDGVRLSVVAERHWREPGYPVSDDHPVTCVSWHDAQAYTEWLSNRTGARYRLPSEAEWEYAARAGSSAAYSFPGGEDGACEFANVSDASAKREVPAWNAVDCDDGVGFGTSAVGRYRANAFGLRDTVGNVWEWVLDCYHGHYGGAPSDGSARGDAGDCGRALDRGGGFSNVFPGHLRSANRSQAPSPDVRVYSLGFRVVRER